MKAGLRRMLSEDRYKVDTILRLFQDDFNRGYGANTFLIGGRTPGKRNNKDQPPHSCEFTGQPLAVNDRIPPLLC